MNIPNKFKSIISGQLLEYTKSREQKKKDRKMRLEELRAMEGVFNLIMTYHDELKRLGVRIIYNAEDMIEEVEKTYMKDGK